MAHARPTKETMTVPLTRQGVRDLDRIPGRVVPISPPAGGAESGQAGSMFSLQSAPGMNVGQVERLVSAIGGGALALIGLSRRSLPGLGLALAGGALLFRGLSGQCYLYRAMGMSTAPQSSAQGETVYRLQ